MNLREDAGTGRARAYLEVDGVRLAYEDDEGDLAPLVCLHAIGHGAGDFATLRARLGRRLFRVVTLDWPGHGASGVDRVPSSAERYAKLLEAFLDARGLRGAVLLGNSVGGAAALRIAVKRPELVSRLVLANPGGLYARSAFSRVFVGAVAGVFARSQAFWFPRFFAAFCRRILITPEAAAQRARIAASAREVAPRLAEAWRSFAHPSSDLRDLAPRVACPVLVAWAVRDPLNPLWANRAAIARFVDARLLTFEAGHAPFLETPQAFDEALLSFLGAPAAPLRLSSEPSPRASSTPA
jgi:4,5:9,10-diseco-3-hydroxy-5,9,17-trioxoandrosta-1(10),2-diene-4-oate hydrolase